MFIVDVSFLINSQGHSLGIIVQIFLKHSAFLDSLLHEPSDNGDEILTDYL
jgi:hypothetical protein